MTTATAKTTVKKGRGLDSKTTTVHVHHAFLYVSKSALHDCDVKVNPILRAPLIKVNTTQKLSFSFSFSKLKCRPFGFNLENLTNI